MWKIQADRVKMWKTHVKLSENVNNLGGAEWKCKISMGGQVKIWQFHVGPTENVKNSGGPSYNAKNSCGAEWKRDIFRWGRVKRAWATFPWVRGIGLQGRISFFSRSRFLLDEGDKYDDDDDDDDGNNYDGNNPFCFICPLLSVEHLVWQSIIF